MNFASKSASKGISQSIKQTSQSRPDHATRALLPFQDNRPETFAQRAFHAAVAQSKGYTALGAGVPTETGFSFDTPIQGVFIYTYPAGSIINSEKSDVEAEGVGLVKLEYDGLAVWADKRNTEAAMLVMMQQYNKLTGMRDRSEIMKKPISEDDHEIRDLDTGLSFIKYGKTYKDKLIVQPKGVGKKHPLFSLGNEYCIVGESLAVPEEVIAVTPAMVRAYWETPDLENETPPQGSFDPKKGYRRHVSLGIDDRYNCAAYALGAGKEWIEPEDMHKKLNNEDDFEELLDANNMVIGRDYIFCTNLHFWRSKKVKDNEYQTSEKNGISGVYERTLDQSQWKDFISDKLNLQIFHKK